MLEFLGRLETTTQRVASSRFCMCCFVFRVARLGFTNECFHQHGAEELFFSLGYSPRGAYTRAVDLTSESKAPRAPNREGNFFEQALSSVRRHLAEKATFLVVRIAPRFPQASFVPYITPACRAAEINWQNRAGKNERRLQCRICHHFQKVQRKTRVCSGTALPREGMNFSRIRRPHRPGRYIVFSLYRRRLSLEGVAE